MHKKKKIILVLILFILMIWSFSCHKKTAYAAEVINGFTFENDQFASNQSNIITTLTALDVNSSIDLTDYYCFISNYSSGSVFLLKKTDTVLSSVSGAIDYYSNYHYLSIVFSSTGAATFRNSFTAHIPFSELSSYDFSSITYNTRYSCDVTLYNAGSGVGKIYDGTDSSVGKSYEFWQAAFVINYSFNLIQEAPDFNPSNTLYGLDLGINETDFYEWLVDNDKVSVSVGSDGGITVSGKIPSYIGMQKLSSFIHFYNQFGSNRSRFISNIKDWFEYMNIASQSNDNVNILKSTMDELYQEYLNSFWHEIHPYFGNIPHHRRNIETNTTDDDTTLITDDPGDSTDTSILRDILRGIISINNSVCDGVVSIKNAIDGLDFTVNVSNSGGISDSSGSGSFNSDYTDKGTFDITPIENPPTIPTPADLEPTINVGSYPLMLGGMANVFLDMLDTMGLKGFYIFAFVLSFLILKLKGG